MSGKGNCWDNAVAESFFKTLKSEIIYGCSLVSAERLRNKVFTWWNVGTIKIVAIRL